MILVTGAAGFIGSCLIGVLNAQGIKEIIIVDDFRNLQKQKNLIGKDYLYKINRAHLFDWLAINGRNVNLIFHLGARTDTTEKSFSIFQRLNLSYSKKIWNFCCTRQIPLIYASSAATYGLGEYGFDDNHHILPQLKPLNPYGISKNDFDKWGLECSQQPPFWVGLKFFNVYGPNEYHKERMASVICHTFRQIRLSNGMKLFRSHNPKFKDGEQRRDFIYVKDIVKVLLFFSNAFQQSDSSSDIKPSNGLYNVGTGRARTFLDLANITFASLKINPNISFIDTPLDIRSNYQYFTEANINKLREAGYKEVFYTLEEGIQDYVGQYLKNETYF